MLTPLNNHSHSARPTTICCFPMNCYHQNILSNSSPKSENSEKSSESDPVCKTSNHPLQPHHSISNYVHSVAHLYNQQAPRYVLRYEQAAKSVLRPDKFIAMEEKKIDPPNSSHDRRKQEPNYRKSPPSIDSIPSQIPPGNP